MLCNLFRRGALIPVVSQVPREDVWRGFPSLTRAEAGCPRSFSWLEKWCRDSPMQQFTVGVRIASFLGRSCQPGSGAWVHWKRQVRREPSLPAVPCGGTSASLGTCPGAEEDCGRKLLLVPSSGVSCQATGSCQWLCNAFGQCCILTDTAAVCAGFNLGGIERKYLGKDCTRRRHINLSSWLNFVIFANVEHIWSGIPFDLFTAFVSHIWRGFPKIDISLIWPGSVFCTETPV